MVQFRRRISIRWLYRRSFRYSLALIFCLSLLRIFKGTGFLDAYSFLSRPLWPGPSQREWLVEGYKLAESIKIDLLEKDNSRLRELLDLKTISAKDKIPAVVISRKINGWWHQLVLNKGNNNGVKIGDSVIAPVGLLGIVQSVTPTTCKVRLLTAPGSRIGAWVDRNQKHGILIGMGTNRTKLSFFDKDNDVRPGDVVSTSPASTIVPPNLPIGVVQSVDRESSPTSFAIIQLIAAPEAIDWVQILKS